MLEHKLNGRVGLEGCVQSVHGSEQGRNVVRHNSKVNSGRVKPSPTSGPVVPEDRSGDGLKVSPHVLDTLIEISHDNIVLSERDVSVNDVVNTLGGAAQIAAMPINRRDLNMTDVLHLNADRDVLQIGARGMRKSGDGEPFGPNEPHSSTRVVVTSGVGKSEMTL